MKILIDLELDGFESEEAMAEGCYEFVYQALNMTASSVEILDYEAEIQTLEAEVRADQREKDAKIAESFGGDVRRPWERDPVNEPPHIAERFNLSIRIANEIRKGTK